MSSKAAMLQEIRGHGTNVPTLADISAAYDRIKPLVHRTPVIQCTSVTNMTKHKNVYFKCENFQKIGAFKMRGATNAIMVNRHLAELAGKPIPNKFVTHSSGNHAQALAKAASLLKCEAHVVMPSNAPKVKSAAVRGYGGIVHECTPTLPARIEKATEVMEANPGSIFIHAYDNPLVIAGQGTLGVEFVEQTNGHLDAVIVPVGGGGLISGVAAAIKGLSPQTKIFAAEPIGADDTSRSYAQGKRVDAHRPGLPRTMADGLLTLNTDRTFAGIKDYVDGVFTVSEEQISQALRIMFERAKIVIEPSAAVGVAVLLANLPELQQFERVGVVICGGNIELDRLAEYLAVGDATASRNASKL